MRSYNLQKVLLIVGVLICLSKASDRNELQNRNPIYIAKTIDGKFCTIPFVYKGVTYHDCISEGKEKRWCSLEKVFQSDKSKWGYCIDHPIEYKGCALGTPNVTAEEVAEILREHNKFRAQQPAYRMKKMEWNSELAQKAQAAADKCYGNHIESILCGSRYETGQNLFYNLWDKDYPKLISWSEVINFWIREEKDYKIETLKCASEKICGHYTQVVWDKSGQIGCGKAFCHGPLYGEKDNVQYSIQYFCNYFESGNYFGTPPYKVNKDEHCKECYNFDPDRKFRCDQDKLCEACQNDEEGCVNQGDMKLLAVQKKICIDTSNSCEDNISLCDKEKNGEWLPPHVLEVMRGCNKTCKRC